ncbi:MAG: RDD family protein [Pseudomonadota bacterium]
MTQHLPDPTYDPAFYENIPSKRVLAWLIDIALITAVTLVIGLMTLTALLWIWPITYFMISFLYRSLTIAGGSATLGMRIMAIELRNSAGQRLSPGEAMGHTLLYLLSWTFAIVQLISIVLMATGARHQGLHDLVMGTVAINRPR